MTAPREPRNRADELVDALQVREGEAGRFTLDPAAAREKLRRFLLPEPRAYPLLLVRAAVQRGADGIDIEMGEDRITMTFDGAPFSRSDLNQGWNAAMGALTGEERPGLRELFLGLLTASRIGGQQVELRCRHPDGSSRLDMESGAPEAWTPTSPRDAPTCVIVSHWEPPPGDQPWLLKRLYGRSVWPEEALLRERCRYAPPEIRLNGKLLSDGFGRFDVALARTKLASDGVRGYAGFFPFVEQTGELALLKDGVILERRERPEWHHGFCVVLEVDQPLDVSESKFVRDAALDAVLEGAEEAYRSQRKALSREDLFDWQEREVALRAWLPRALYEAVGGDGSRSGVGCVVFTAILGGMWLIPLLVFRDGGTRANQVPLIVGGLFGAFVLVMIGLWYRDKGKAVQRRTDLRIALEKRYPSGTERMTWLLEASPFLLPTVRRALFRETLADLDHVDFAVIPPPLQRIEEDDAPGD